MTGSDRFLRAGDRAAVVAGLREFADYLEAHPDVPVPGERSFVHALVFTEDYGDGDEQSCRAEVERVAAALGTAVKDGEHYVAERRFGPVRYRVVHIPAQVARDHHARNSYADAVQVDPEGVDR